MIPWFWLTLMLVGLILLSLVGPGWWRRHRVSRAPSLTEARQALLRDLNAKQGHQLDDLLRDHLAILQDLGWSDRVLAVVYLPELAQRPDQAQAQFEAAQLFGSRLFRDLWHGEMAELSAGQAKQLLRLALRVLELPEDLSGQVLETQTLLSRMAPKLSPTSAFWKQLARTVDLAFPQENLSRASDDLAKQVHQLRYLLSAQQAQWVRDNYRRGGETDRQALIRYLASRPARRFLSWGKAYDLRQSARLHNKPLKEGQARPNLKILMGFHVEFILDDQGRFANELDPEGTNLNGIINGASFNYASRNGNRHRQLDIQPVVSHDPDFRRRLLGRKRLGYRAPSRPRTALGTKRGQWEHSFYNRRGRFAQDGQSLSSQVSLQAKHLQKAIRKARKQD